MSAVLLPGRVRRIAARLSVLLLVLPASSVLPRLEWNLHVWQRLRAAHRISPDIDLDESYRSLDPYLPVQGPIGLHNVGPPDDGRLRFRLQYALAPRRIVPSALLEFTIECGPAASAASLARNPAFALVITRADDLRLFRKIQR